jgi:O-antigen/teichoic acid export membrane protein
MLARLFGASTETDTYFVSATILGFLSILPGFFTDQFLQFYNDSKAAKGDTQSFYFAVWVLSLGLGVAIAFVTWLFRRNVMYAFVPGFSQASLESSTDYFTVLLVSMPISRVVAVNNVLVNAEMKFGLPYLMGCVTPILNIAALLLFAGQFGINVIAVSIVAAQTIILVIQQTYISRHMKFGFRVVLWHRSIPGLMRNSFSIRLGHQIYSLRDPLTSNLLSRFPPGTITLFSFSYKLIAVLYSVTNSPIIQIFSSKVSMLVSHGRIGEIRKLLKETTIRNTILFLSIIVFSLFVIRAVLSYFFGGRFTSEDILTIVLFFQAFIPLYFILSMESPMVSLIVAMKRGSDIIKISLINIVLYGMSAFLVLHWMTITWLPAAIGLAQVANLFLYFTSVRRVMRSGLNLRLQQTSRVPIFSSGTEHWE